jgi:hypothetical protein
MKRGSFKKRLFLSISGAILVTVLSLFISSDRVHATEGSSSEQVIVSPAQQAVNTALSTANTEVQEAITATNNALVEVTQAQTEYSQAQGVTAEVATKISLANTEVNNVQTAINTISSVDLSVTPIDQSSQVVQDAKATVTTATTAINNITTQIAEAQTAISEAVVAKTEASTAQATAQTELTQANLAIDAAQTAVNNLQATIGTTVNVLAGVDDAGVQMNLPFGMQMGGTVYNNVFVGSNATITFGNNEGHVYWDTPGAPSISIAGWDWTTWSTGTGITYSTTGTSLDVAWDLRPFPQQDASTQMVQIRFNADVNPNDGAWMANVTAVGPIPGGARFNYRETTNGAITPITDTNSGTGFAGQISQGSAFTPYVDPNTSTIQAAVDSANATITQLNQSLSPVVAQNTTNTSNINAINTTSLTNTVNSAVSTKTSLQSTLNTKAGQLTSAINNNIPTPAPVLAEPIIAGTTVTITPELPAGYTANTWFYQVVTDDPDAENPYEGGTYNTDGAPESIQLTGLTEGATYTIRVANWSGPVSQYTETVISIPAQQSSNITTGGGSAPSYDPVDNNEQTQPDETTPDEGDSTEPEPSPDENNESSEGDESQDTDTPESDDSSSNDEQDNTPEENEGTDEEESQDNDTLSVEEIQEAVSELIEDGNITAADAEAVLDALSADGEITTNEVVNLSEVLSEDGVLTSAEKDLVADALVESTDGAPVAASDIAAAGLEYRDLPPQIPVEVREDANGNPVVITAEVASALLTLESPAALAGAIIGCFNPDEAIEGLTEEQKCEVFKALANIGADMSPQERQDAKEVLVAAILVGQVILGSSIIRIRG